MCVFISHRPLSIENIYNAVQTRIVLKQEQVDSDIPDYEDIFRDDEVMFMFFSDISAKFLKRSHVFSLVTREMCLIWLKNCGLYQMFAEFAAV